jgi:hypothetical protein
LEKQNVFSDQHQIHVQPTTIGCVMFQIEPFAVAQLITTNLKPA